MQRRPEADSCGHSVTFLAVWGGSSSTGLQDAGREQASTLLSVLNPSPSPDESVHQPLRSQTGLTLTTLSSTPARALGWLLVHLVKAFKGLLAMCVPQITQAPVLVLQDSPWNVLHDAFKGVCVWGGLLSLSPAPGLTAVQSVPLPLLVSSNAE